MIERRQPLPVGRYWLDVRTGSLDPFLAWARSNPTRIEHSEAVETRGPGRSIGVTFFIFRVLQPTHFDQRSFGFPTVATPDVQRAADTAQRPDAPKPLDVLNDLLNQVHLPSLDGLGAMILHAGAYLLMKDK